MGAAAVGGPHGRPCDSRRPQTWMAVPTANRRLFSTPARRSWRGTIDRTCASGCGAVGGVPLFMAQEVAPLFLATTRLRRTPLQRIRDPTRSPSARLSLNCHPRYAEVSRRSARQRRSEERRAAGSSERGGEGADGRRVTVGRGGGWRGGGPRRPWATCPDAPYNARLARARLTGWPCRLHRRSSWRGRGMPLCCSKVAESDHRHRDEFGTSKFCAGKWVLAEM